MPPLLMLTIPPPKRTRRGADAELHRAIADRGAAGVTIRAVREDERARSARVETCRARDLRADGRGVGGIGHGDGRAVGQDQRRRTRDGVAATAIEDQPRGADHRSGRSAVPPGEAKMAVPLCHAEFVVPVASVQLLVELSHVPLSPVIWPSFTAPWPSQDCMAAGLRMDSGTGTAKTTPSLFAPPFRVRCA